MEKVKKRDRSVNFKREETDLLLSLIEPKIKIIENKKSDAVTWNDKEKTWMAIEKEFNHSTSGIHRSARHLKLKYEALKRDARKKACIIRRGRCVPTNSSGEVCLTAAEKKVFNMILQTADCDFNEADQICSIESTPNMEYLCTELDPTDAIETNINEEQNDDICSSKCNIEVFENNGMENICQEEEALLNTANNFYTKGKHKKKRKIDDLIESVTDMVLLKKKIMEEEISEKLLQKKTVEEELQHRREMRELEKQQMLLKIEVLKAELECTRRKE